MFEVEGEVLWVTSDSGHDDNQSLLTLELLHRAHIYVLKLSLLQQLPNLLDLLKRGMNIRNCCFFIELHKLKFI